MATDRAPKLRSLTVRAVRVRMREPHPTASGAVAESPLALQPVAELIRNVATLIDGEPLAPAEIEQRLARRFRLLGTLGTGVTWDEAAVRRYSV